MNLTLGAIAVVILAAIAGLWMFARRMRQVGEATTSAKVAEETVDILRRQAQASADAPQGKASVIDRLRKGGGL